MAEAVFLSVAAGTPPSGATKSVFKIKDESGKDVTSLVNEALSEKETLEIAENCLEVLYNFENPEDLENKRFHGTETPNDASKSEPYSECYALKQSELQGNQSESRKKALIISSYEDEKELNVLNAKKIFVSFANIYDPSHAKSKINIARKEKEDHESAFDSSDSIEDKPFDGDPEDSSLEESGDSEDSGNAESSET
jgi:hypothetical protein